MRLDYKWQAALITAVGLFMAVLDNTIVNVALPQMADAFKTDRNTIQWVVTAYFLAQAAIIPVTGYLSDLIGTKRVFIGALLFFTLGSFLCVFAPNKELLFTFRVLQGIGGGALFPTAFAIIFRVFPPMERGAASAVLGVPVLLAPAFGPTIGGYLTTTFTWSAIFLVNVPIGIITVLLAWRILHAREAEDDATVTAGAASRPQPQRGRFDVVGLILSMAGFTALVYGITQAASKSWNDPSVLPFLIGGGMLLVAFVINELLVKDPVMDVRLFLNYTFTASNILIWAISAFLFGSLILLPFFFEGVQNLTALSTGEIFITQGLAAALATIFSGRFYNRIGPRWLAAIGFALVTLGTIGLTKFTVSTTGADLQWWLILRGLGLGFANIPLQTLVLSVVSNRAMARASSLVNVTRQVAGAIGITILNTYLTQQTTNHVAAVTKSFFAGPVASATAKCVAQLGHSPAVQACVGAAAKVYIGQNAFVMGLNDAFVLAAIATGICTVLALFVGRDPNLVAAKRAAARGEAVEGREARPAIVGE